ncbi:MAG: hypothetical protein HKN09_06670 [Saprospiraceae bacterium]|nr:hypothetical protein [Saprospiraceae bacterium]
MSIIRFIGLIVFLIGINFSGQCQTESSFDITQFSRHNNKFIYGDKTYKYKELGGLFTDHNDFQVWFNRTMQQKRQIHTIGASSLGIFGIGVLFVALSPEGLGQNGNYIPLIIGGLGFNVTLLKFINLSQAKRKSIQALEGNLDPKDRAGIRDISFDVRLATGSVGVIMTF